MSNPAFVLEADPTSHPVPAQTPLISRSDLRQLSKLRPMRSLAQIAFEYVGIAAAIDLFHGAGCRRTHHGELRFHPKTPDQRRDSLQSRHGAPAQFDGENPGSVREQLHRSEIGQRCSAPAAFAEIDHFIEAFRNRVRRFDQILGGFAGGQNRRAEVEVGVARDGCQLRRSGFRRQNKGGFALLIEKDRS